MKRYNYDHLGTINGQIMNGADDNGSGVVAALEVARSLTQSKSFARSIIVAFYTGEEVGLLGSSYFAQTNQVLNNIVLNINLDMVGRGSKDTIFIVGPDLCCDTLKTIIRQINNEFTNFVLDYSNSDNDRIKRSDLAPFYTNKIPIADFSDNVWLDYHQPTDDADKINYDKIYKTAVLVKSIATEISNMKDRLIFNDKPR